MLVLFSSGSWSNGDADRSIYDETSQIHCRWSYCMVENMSTRFSHWPTTESSRRVNTTPIATKTTIIWSFLENKHGFGHWATHIVSKIVHDTCPPMVEIPRWIQEMLILFDIPLVMHPAIRMKFVISSSSSVRPLSWFCVGRKRRRNHARWSIEWNQSTSYATSSSSSSSTNDDIEYQYYDKSNVRKSFLLCIEISRCCMSKHNWKSSSQEQKKS